MNIRPVTVQNPITQSEYFKYYPHYSGVKIYQNTPDTILNLPDDNFKSKLGNFLYEKLYYK